MATNDNGTNPTVLALPEPLQHAADTLEVAQHVIALQISLVLGAVNETHDATNIKVLTANLFSCLHDQAAELEVMLLATGIDAEALDTIVDGARGDALQKAREMREGMARAERVH